VTSQPETGDIPYRTQGGHHPSGLLPVEIRALSLKAGEGALALGLAAVDTGNPELAADSFRAIVLFLDRDPESIIHQTALRLLNEVTAPKESTRP
jgi:hypothetical protein